MKITRLEYQKKDPNFVSVFIDDKFITSLSANDIIKLGLHNGQEITVQELSKIIADSTSGKLFNTALNFLSYRPRSEWEIRQHLNKKDPSKQTLVVQEVIDRLKTIGQINDQEFAKWYLDQRKTFKPMGKRALKYELIRKGLDRKLIASLLAKENEGNEELSEFALAMKAVQKRTHSSLFTTSSRKDPQRAKERLQRFLAGRGFDWEIINEVLAKVLPKEYTKD